ncbi:MAG: inner-membrane translocator [Lachnospiraceae bacterium]|nr:inner-membrane translocator [Lachnospiraceae bacterium]
MKKTSIKNQVSNLVPLGGLLALIIAFLVIGTVKDINITYGLKSVVNQSVVVAMVATGAVFIYTLGSFDISLGASTAVSALLGGIVCNATGSVAAMFLACLGVAILVSLIDSILASVLNLPVFVTTIAMLSVLNALILILISANGTGDQIAVPSAMVAGLNTIAFKIVLLAVFFAACVFVFNFTKVGRSQKFIGGNPVCAKLSGVPAKKMSIIAFVMAGCAVGLGAFLSVVYAPTLTRNTASSVGMDVIIAIAFGGMPVSGGARSRIQSAVIGAFSITFLSQIMTIFNLNSGIGQMVKSVIFILVVFIATLNQRQKMLPR